MPDAPSHWLDRLYLRFSPAVPCFQDGWGDLEAVRNVVLEELPGIEPTPIAPTWSRVEERSGMWVRRGRFYSPVAVLPAMARTGHVLWAGPVGRAPVGVCVALSAWNDEDFSFRLDLLAPLVKDGWAVMLLQNPLYGARRIAGRRRGTPRTVAEFLQLGFGTILEARSLLAGVRGIGCEVPAVVGFSMGGHMAALTAATLPFPVRVVPMAPSCTPAAVFLDGLLAAGTHHEALDDGARGTGAQRLRTLLDRFSVDCVPPPVAPELAHVVGTRSDGIVPPQQAERIARHWDVPVHWIDTGHVGAVTLAKKELVSALRVGLGR